jgi:hypothetical protein
MMVESTLTYAAMMEVVKLIPKVEPVEFLLGERERVALDEAVGNASANAIGLGYQFGAIPIHTRPWAHGMTKMPAGTIEKLDALVAMVGDQAALDWIEQHLEEEDHG